MDNYVNLIKLSVGSESVEALMAWQNVYRRQFADGQPRHITRMWPKREKELVNGGSIYWVIKGEVQCRQKILRLDAHTGEDGIRRCAIVLGNEIFRTTSAPRRPFQGWRYLTKEDAPLDLTADKKADSILPASLAKALSDIGIL